MEQKISRTIKIIIEQ